MDDEGLYEGQQKSQLGCPIPLDQHAVSVSFPTWNDIEGYEEGDKRVKDQVSIVSSA
jgi:hypothetical protein